MGGIDGTSLERGICIRGEFEWGKDRKGEKKDMKKHNIESQHQRENLLVKISFKKLYKSIKSTRILFYLTTRIKYHRKYELRLILK